jgi:predicted MFS family arabinose efflux permease
MIPDDARIPDQRTLVAAIAASAAGILFYNMMPVYLGSMQDATGFTPGQIGIVASVFFAGFNLASASAYFWVRKVSLRAICAAGALALCLFFSAATFVQGYGASLFLTFLIGSISGALGSVAATVVGDARDSMKWFGVKVAAESAVGVLLLFVLPATLIRTFGFAGTVAGMSIAILLLLPVILLMRKGSLSGVATLAPHEARTAGISRMPVWLALFAMLILFCGGSAIWAFEERIANQYAFDPVWVGMILGVSLVFSVFGSLGADVAKSTLGSSRAYALGAFLMVAGVLAIAGSAQSSSLFALGAIAFMLGWGAAVPLLYGKIAESDPDGRHIALAIPAIGIGSMIGPSVAGFLYASGSMDLLQWSSVAAIGASSVIVFLAPAKRPSLR